MAGQTVDASQALSIGFVHAVYPEAEFGSRVEAFARHLAGLPREAVGLAKIGIDIAATVDRRTAREFDRLAQTVMFTSDEFRARIDAFMRRGR